MWKIWTFLLLAIYAAPLIAAPASAVAAPSADSVKLLAVGPDDRVLGDSAAPITIVEYASLSCPHCAHFTNEVLPELKKKWIDTGKVKLVLRDFPLDEPALRAAMIARCAPPDRFYAFVDTFFGAQDKWVTGSDYLQSLARLAKLGGMGKEEFDACLKNTALENKILDSRLVASKELEVNATPTFFINGTKFVGAPTVDEFDRQLSALAPKS